MNLTGLWSLARWETVWSDGTRQPYSEQGVSGFLLYSEQGQVAVSIYESEQGKVLSTYAGRYELVDGEAIHYPTVGLSPAGIQEKKVRRLTVREHDMTMETAWSESGLRSFQYQLNWLRT